MAAKGHEDAFPRPTLSARCQISQRTFARTRGNGRDAPIAAICTRAIELAGSTRSRRSLPVRHRPPVPNPEVPVSACFERLPK